MKSGSKLSNLENEVLNSLIEGFKTKFPVQALALFMPKYKNASNNINLIYPNTDKYFELKNSFINDRVVYFNEHEYTTSNLFSPSHYWKSYELGGIEIILENLGIKMEEVQGLADFVFPIRKIPVIGLLINPFSSRDGAVTRELVRFSDKDQKRLGDFLHPYHERIRDITLAKSEATIEILEELFGDSGLTETPHLEEYPHLKEYEAESFLKEKEGKFGGDFIKALGNNREILYFLGDVSGHSVYASRLNYSLRNSLITLTVDNIPKLNHLMNKLNVITMKSVQEGRFQKEKFVTAFAFKADKQGNLSYSSAGHKGYVLRNNGSIDSLENDLSSNFPLGLFTNGTYTSNQTKLSQGDIIAVWSDGYYETQNLDGELFGNQRVLDCLKEYRMNSLKEIIDNLEGKVKEFSSYNFDDDRSILLVRYLG